MSQLTDNLNAIASIKSDIAAAIESKGVSMTGVPFGSYADKIGEIQTGGSFVTEPLNVTYNGTFTPGQGVDGYSQVTVNVPQSVTGYTEKDWTEGCFSNISNLNNGASVVQSNVFRCNINLRTVYLPNCSKIYYQAFWGCDYLTTVDLPNCTGLGEQGFYSCSRLSQINIPNVNWIPSGAFEGCSNLSVIDIHNATFIGANAFMGCSRLSYISLPNCKSIQGAYPWGGWSGTFYGCKNLASISLPVCSYIGSNTFMYCYSLSQITLGSASVCTLRDSNAFTGTPIKQGTGSIYVPSSLVDAYKSANNWSRFSSIIFPIPE